MKISVAMATYNGTKYVRDQLESLSAQTRLPDELVVSDEQRQLIAHSLGNFGKHFDIHSVADATTVDT